MSHQGWAQRPHGAQGLPARGEEPRMALSEGNTDAHWRGTAPPARGPRPLRTARRLPLTDSAIRATADTVRPNRSSPFRYAGKSCSISDCFLTQATGSKILSQTPVHMDQKEVRMTKELSANRKASEMQPAPQCRGASPPDIPASREAAGAGSLAWEQRLAAACLGPTTFRGKNKIC